MREVCFFSLRLRCTVVIMLVLPEIPESRTNSRLTWKLRRQTSNHAKKKKMTQQTQPVVVEASSRRITDV